MAMVTRWLARGLVGLMVAPGFLPARPVLTVLPATPNRPWRSGRSPRCLRRPNGPSAQHPAVATLAPAWWFISPFDDATGNPVIADVSAGLEQDRRWPDIVGVGEIFGRHATPGRRSSRAAGGGPARLLATNQHLGGNCARRATQTLLTMGAAEDAMAVAPEMTIIDRLAGKIDELAVYGRALSADQIKALACGARPEMTTMKIMARSP
jgi:hypothetical protein